MTQNGKSSLIQQILRYAGENEKARRVEIGQGNFSQTQTCSIYDVDVPLKIHRLRQIDGPEDECWRNGDYVIPGQDLEFNDLEEYQFGHDVQDSGECLPLRLIDTPGLSDSGNAKSSNSGMRVMDERHKLRILLTLQEVEDIHAICIVVRRDTNYGGDFQDLVQRMVSLLGFSVPSTAWNMQYHIIHTNIDVDDRGDGVCKARQDNFDGFGPPGAIHHFVDNTPQEEVLDLYFANHSLSSLFNSLAVGSPVKFSDLRYAKSPEHECNDATLIHALECAKDEMCTEIDELRRKIVALENDITDYTSRVERSETLVKDLEKKIEEIDCDTLSQIDGAYEEGWTETNIAGGGHRYFSFHTTVPISYIDKDQDGDGDWVDEHRETTFYRVVLQPHWLLKAFGRVTLFAKKRDKHESDITALNSHLTPEKRRLQENLDRISRATMQILGIESQIIEKGSNIKTLVGDLEVVRKSHHSISLGKSQELIKFFTVDSPLSAAYGYQLKAKIPWTVWPLNKLPKQSFKSVLRRELNETKARMDKSKESYKTLPMQLSIAQGVSVIMTQLKHPPLGAAKLKSAIEMLHHWQRASARAESQLGKPGSNSLGELMKKLEKFESSALSWPVSTIRPGSEDIREEILKFSRVVNIFEQEVFDTSHAVFKELQNAILDHKAAQVAKDYLNQDDGLPVGAFASLTRAAPRGDGEEAYPTLLCELKEIGELGEMALEE
ncbi:unnamed protein product [Clonostachys rhizophaga]|uniref:G domain-containing protein n=1 Tax=Clonostachys rhizophaga TaxID=160324 RepID=A0A9N9YPG6_9HYPO|nr:unnamed protein product [Clonostachys rhizophaga]